MSNWTPALRIEITEEGGEEQAADDGRRWTSGKSATPLHSKVSPKPVSLRRTAAPSETLARLQAVGGGRRPRWRRYSLRKRRPQRLPAPGDSRPGAERFPLRERWCGCVHTVEQRCLSAVALRRGGMALSGPGHQAIPYVAARRRGP